MQRLLLSAVVVLSFACQKVDKNQAAGGSGSAGSGSGGSAAAAPKRLAVESSDILARTTTVPEAHVKHVLFAWKDLTASYPQGAMDPRAQNRTQQQAEALAKEVAGKLKAKPGDIDALMKQYSEDPGSRESGEPYVIKPDSPMVPEFKQMALRLEVNEVGIVKSSFGLHVMLRIAPPPPPPPDPLESADILARPGGEKGPVHIQHVLISIKGGARAAPDAPTKEEADKIAKEVFDKAKAGGDMKELMKTYSKDPGSAANGRAYPVTEGSGMIEPFEKMALRLKENEVGMVKTQFGWHVMKRIPPPPPPAPDKLDSVDILKREVKTQKATVKHILLGWKEVHADDERGKKRERKDLEKLVKATVARLKKGEKIDALMAELSEDEGSAKTGQSYPVTPDARLVEPFKQLSLRLDVNEVGVVKTDFGIHIIQRIE